MDLIKDKWRGPKTCLKRFVDTGRDDGRVTPWLVRDVKPGASPRPGSYAAPRRDFSDVAGYDCRGLVVFECEPHMPKKDRVLSLLGSGITRVHTHRDYPVILARIHQEILREFGPKATVPYP